ncbi:hypothetical protein FC15_GL000831 [Lapidilactobacillus concavus DSM 17758]|uniref:Protein kinase domain-containing protein n=2 Tax=Lapidilactobacillus TaxID=2767884 RepID=A0A0R1W2C1_9LACO|nr:protein kinase [Lapidilactobacillus concavus]KRM11730.1 hypothetical protein FC15_GL000831 [Lapidilactobacillus concavus DSM 17758]
MACPNVSTLSNILVNMTVRKDDQWIYAMDINNPLPLQGWKIHISCTPDNFEKVLFALIKECSSRPSFSFKIPSTHHNMLNMIYGRNGYLVTGKMITIYPVDQSEKGLAQLCLRIAPVTQSTPIPIIPTDIRFGDTSLFLRYGAFTKIKEYDTFGAEVPSLFNNHGKIVPDIRAINHFKPNWIDTPQFIELSKVSSNNSDIDFASHGINNLQLISRNSKGAVFHIIQNNAVRILKQGLGELMVDGHHTSGADRFLNEVTVLNQLPKYVEHPKVYDYFTNGNNFYEVQEEIVGEKLFNLLYLNKTRIIKDPLKLIVQIHQQLCMLHKAGFIFRDLSAYNIIIDSNLKPHLIDFELSCKIGSANPLPGGSPGFFPLHIKERTDAGSSQFADSYALGAIIFLITTKIVPVSPEMTDGKTRSQFIKRLQNLTLPLNLNQQERQLAAIGIKLMNNIDTSDSTISELLSTVTHENTGITNYSIAAHMGELPLKYPTHILTNQFYQQKLNLELILPLSHFVKEKHSIPEFTELLGYLKNYLLVHPFDELRPHNLIKGDIYLINLIEKVVQDHDLYRQQFINYEAMWLQAFLTFDYNKFPIGILYGISGIGITILRSMNNSPTPEIKQIKEKIVNIVYNESVKNFV